MNAAPDASRRAGLIFGKKSIVTFTDNSVMQSYLHGNARASMSMTHEQGAPAKRRTSRALDAGCTVPVLQNLVAAAAFARAR